MDRIEERLGRLKRRVALNHDHLMTAVAAQREQVDHAFAQIRTTFLAQELALRKYSQDNLEAVQDLTEAVRDLNTSR